MQRLTSFRHLKLGFSKFTILNNKRQLYSFNRNSFSYQNDVKSYDLSLVENFKQGKVSDITGIANVARVLNKYNLSDQSLVLSIEKSSIPHIKSADVADLRKIMGLYVKHYPSDEFLNALKERQAASKETVNIGEFEFGNVNRFGYGFRLNVWFLRRRNQFLSLFKGLGIGFK